ncbi:MAG: 2,3-bisphosphoglycerate-independent phosphoglycerate mutase, partial [Candidatus Heimdallarchaeota archaeon]|nr:2,3-bisphosphoglycerate-independent phosphoglycerate mutase [Candidatus Heimdallarchaeota archaeon]
MSSRNSRPRVVLTIVDGFGISTPSAGNAVTLAKTPAWDELRANHPHIALDASSQAVGLPGDTMGNSEVGHLTIGSGRIIFQSLERINQSCNDGSFAENTLFRSIQNHLAKT